MQTNKRIQAKKIRIMLVDDDPDITLTFKTGLELNEFDVKVFNEPRRALFQFRPEDYDLILIDVKMPGMNGFELYRELLKADPNAKVCFITSFVAYYESLLEIFPSAKEHCFIKKPIEIKKLVNLIKAELVR